MGAVRLALGSAFSSCHLWPPEISPAVFHNMGFFSCFQAGLLLLPPSLGNIETSGSGAYIYGGALTADLSDGREGLLVISTERRIRCLR